MAHPTQEHRGGKLGMGPWSVGPDPFERRKGQPESEWRSFDPSGGHGSSTFGQALQRALNLGGRDQVTRPFIESSWVHMCLGLISDMAASVPLRLRRSEDPDSEPVDSHPLLELLESPNEFLTGRSLVKGLVIDWYHDGEQFWFLSDAKGKPVDITRGRLPELVNPVRGALVPEPRPGDIERNGPVISIKQWRTESAGAEYTFPAESVVQIKRYNPYSPVRGMGLLNAILRTVNNNFQVERYDDALLKSGGTPPYALVYPNGVNRKLLEEARTAYREKNQRGEREAEPLFLGGGVTAQPLGLAPHEMEFREMRAWYRDLILAAFRVPLVLLGRETEGGFSRAGQEEARLAFHEDVIAPLLRALEGELNARLVEPMGLSERLYFDDSELREDSLDSLIERTGALVDIGVSFNKAAELAGWKIDPLEDDELQSRPSPPEGPIPPGTPSTPAPPGDEGDGAPERSVEHAAGPSGTFHYELRTLDRAAYLKRFDESLTETDDRLEAQASAVFDEMLDDITDRIRDLAGSESRAVTDADLEYLLGEIDPWKQRIADDLQPLVASSFLQQSENLLAEFGFIFSEPTSLTSRDPNAAAFLLQKEIRLKETVQTFRDDVKAAIFEALEDGDDSVGNLQSRIRTRLEAVEDSIDTARERIPERARRIARTESTGIANGSRVLTMQANGIKRHEWVAIVDSATRDSHAGLDGDVVAVGTKFRNGLRWPGDTTGDASEVVNCRCTTLPVVEELEEPTPEGIPAAAPAAA